MEATEKTFKSDIRVLYYNNITPENIQSKMKIEGIENLEMLSKYFGFQSFKSAYYTIISKHLIN